MTINRSRIDHARSYHHHLAPMQSTDCNRDIHNRIHLSEYLIPQYDRFCSTGIYSRVRSHSSKKFRKILILSSRSILTIGLRKKIPIPTSWRSRAVKNRIGNWYRYRRIYISCFNLGDRIIARTSQSSQNFSEIFRFFLFALTPA